MAEIGEITGVGISSDQEECIFCHQKHKKKEEEKLPDHTYVRDDATLTSAGRSFIKGDSTRAQVYPKDEEGNFVSPLVDPKWDEDTIFKKYQPSSGKERAHAAKYQPPPIMGWVGAPHHMVAICCMNGTNKLPGVPKVNPWSHRGGYDINNGGNCIFLPSSASQFFVAYYYWKVRHKGRALQGHLGAHRKIYFETVWDRLEMMVMYLWISGWCKDTDTEEEKNKLAKKAIQKLDALQDYLFRKLAATKPAENFKLGAQSYIEIPDESDEFGVPEGVTERLQPYETLPEWY